MNANSSQKDMKKVGAWRKRETGSGRRSGNNCKWNDAQSRMVMQKQFERQVILFAIEFRTVRWKRNIMTANPIHLKPQIISAALAVLACLTVSIAPTNAQVILNPNTLTGTV